MFDNPRQVLLDRRRFLTSTASGLGAVALSSLLCREGLAGGSAASGAAGPLSATHHVPRARRVIHVFSPGGVSHVDTFDYRPELNRMDGRKLTGKGQLDPFFGRPGVLRKSFFPFRQYGESGTWVSDLFPHLATCVDDLTFFHAVVTKSSSHTPACFQMNTGFTQAGYPGLGSWLSYGLGTMNEELPTFVVLPDHRGLPNGGTNNWTNGFLPARHQGTAFSTKQNTSPVPNLATPESVSPRARSQALETLAGFNRNFARRHPGDDELAARIAAYELAARMQTSIPEAVDFRTETRETQQLYGMDDERTAGFARNCLLARRLIERGVQFVQLYNGGALGSPRINWDAHEDLVRNHNNQGILLDRPLAGLLQDLKRRGMLEDTLVLWTSEFGRTPFTQGEGGLGRDHHPLCFTVWMAGAGLKPGLHYGQSDEVGYQPAENATTVYDLHATILHLLGIDHERLTYYHNGIDRRLTDVHGHVIQDVLA
ncbi:MAG: DUF1501 domain-containing protein [Planctomycetaceae bacterium]|nr:DUF1501 domain-containing protein [Planctomycetaceae bacterium]